MVDQRKDDDTDLIIREIDDDGIYLRSAGGLRWKQVKTQIRNNIDDIYLKVLSCCIKSRSREEIFEYIGSYNNSRNFRNYIKPLIDVGWIKLTIADKPTSKNQKYIIAGIAKILVGPEKQEIHRIPVFSSTIASVGYDAEKQILEIEFQHGAIYQYIDVPKKVYEGLVSSASIGSYFMHNIKNKFSYQKT